MKLLLQLQPLWVKEEGRKTEGEERKTEGEGREEGRGSGGIGRGGGGGGGNRDATVFETYGGWRSGRAG
jgi:hypothetical protein